MAGLFDGTPLERPVTCDRCGQILPVCRCPPLPPPPVATKLPGEQHPRVRREKRRGKWNTVVGGLDGDAAALKTLLKTLRTGLGAGGGVTDGELILQGDHRDQVVLRLKELGYRAKPAGG